MAVVLPTQLEAIWINTLRRYNIQALLWYLVCPSSALSIASVGIQPVSELLMEAIQIKDTAYSLSNPDDRQ